MFIRGLKTKIAINIAVLLFLAMLLIDLVTIVTVRRELIRSEVLRANVLLTSLAHRIVMSPHAAKRLAELLDKLMVEYTARYGELK